MGLSKGKGRGTTTSHSTNCLSSTARIQIPFRHFSIASNQCLRSHTYPDTHLNRLDVPGVNWIIIMSAPSRRVECTRLLDLLQVDCIVFNI